MTGVILVGAGPRLGASVARRFAREGFGVSLVSRRASTLAMIRDTLAPYDVPVAGYPADAGRAYQLEPALLTAIDDHGAPDVVVYNAAVVRADGPGELSVEELARPSRSTCGARWLRLWRPSRACGNEATAHFW